jgi:hypothetical protein
VARHACASIRSEILKEFVRRIDRPGERDGLMLAGRIIERVSGALDAQEVAIIEPWSAFDVHLGQEAGSEALGLS